MPKVVSVFGVEPFRIGGTETFARELSRQLGERDWDSVLCFLKEPKEEVRRFLSLSNVSLEILNEPAGLSWSATQGLARIIRHYQPDVLHLHFTGFLGIYPWLARLLGVKKIFLTDHTSRPIGYQPQQAPFWKRAFARAVNKPLTNVICVSQYGRDCLTTLDLLPKERHELIYNAVDLARVNNDPARAQQFRRRHAISENKVVIVQVSWMIPEKGIGELLKVAEILISGNENVHFVLVGEGSHRERFVKDAHAAGIAEHITWTGRIEDPFGEGVFDAADIVCQLSQWEELFGWMIAEGMAHGKPIVATRVGGIPELVVDGQSGFLVERGTTSAAADKLEVLLRNPALRRKMGQYGRAIVADKFDLKRNVAQLIELYGS